MQNIKFLNVDVGKIHTFEIKRDVFDNMGKKIATKVLSFFALVCFGLSAPCYGMEEDGNEAVPESPKLTTATTGSMATRTYTVNTTTTTTTTSNIEGGLSNLLKDSFPIELFEQGTYDHKKFENFPYRTERTILRDAVLKDKKIIKEVCPESAEDSKKSRALVGHMLRCDSEGINSVSNEITELHLSFVDHIMDAWQDLMCCHECHNLCLRESPFRPLATLPEILDTTLRDIRLPRLAKAHLPKFSSVNTVTRFVNNHWGTLKFLDLDLGQNMDAQDWEAPDLDAHNGDMFTRLRIFDFSYGDEKKLNYTKTAHNLISWLSPFLKELCVYDVSDLRAILGGVHCPKLTKLTVDSSDANNFISRHAKQLKSLSYSLYHRNRLCPVRCRNLKEVDFYGVTLENMGDINRFLGMHGGLESLTISFYSINSQEEGQAPFPFVWLPNLKNVSLYSKHFNGFFSTYISNLLTQISMAQVIENQCNLTEITLSSFSRDDFSVFDLAIFNSSGAVFGALKTLNINIEMDLLGMHQKDKILNFLARVRKWHPSADIKLNIGYEAFSRWLTTDVSAFFGQLKSMSKGRVTVTKKFTFKSDTL